MVVVRMRWYIHALGLPSVSGSWQTVNSYCYFLWCCSYTEPCILVILTVQYLYFLYPPLPFSYVSEPLCFVPCFPSVMWSFPWPPYTCSVDFKTARTLCVLCNNSHSLYGALQFMLNNCISITWFGLMCVSELFQMVLPSSVVWLLGPLQRVRGC